MPQKRFSILGCGWLGLPLASALVSEGFLVKGTTTTKEKLAVLSSKNIEPFLINIEEDLQGDIDNFLDSDILLINIPYRKQKEHLDSYKKLIAKIENSTIEKVIFISSTSVYKDTNSVVTESKYEENPAKKDLLAFEALFLNNPKFKTTIIRFSGLIGGTRNPGNFLKEGRTIANGLAPVNLIHLEDCIGIIKAIVHQEKWNTIFNACADTHPTKKEYYTKASEQIGNIPATYTEEKNSFKVISNQKLKDELDYTFIYPDLLESLNVFKL